MDLTTPLFKTAADTLGTSALISQTLPPGTLEQTAIVQNIGTDWKAPVIALASSVIIQLVLKGLSWFAKKLSPKATIPPLAQ